MSNETADDKLEGVVELRVIDAGSKGERTAAVLITEASITPLALRGAVALDDTSPWAAIEGLRVRVIGTMGWRTFVVDRWEPISPRPSSSEVNEPRL